MGSGDISDGITGGINLLQKQFLTFLTGAKERLIDFVFEYKAQNMLEKNPKEQNLIQTSFDLNNSMVKEKFFVNESDKEKSGLNMPLNQIPNQQQNQGNSFINQSQNSGCFRPMPNNIGTTNRIYFNQNMEKVSLLSKPNRDDEMVIETEMNELNSTNFISPSHTFDTHLGKDIKKDSSSMEIDFNNLEGNNSKFEFPKPKEEDKVFSKRVLSELVKCDIDDRTRNFIIDISKKIEEKFLDISLNVNPKKDYKINQHFVCYVAEYKEDLIKEMFKIKEVPHDLTIRIIVPVKELYNLVLEIYFSISDLSYTNVDTFVEAAGKKGISMKFAQIFYLFIRTLMKIVLVEEHPQKKMKEIFQKFYDVEYTLWDKHVNKKCKELTSFCII